ncbi:MAG: hypothetical protein GY869_00065, partial [Planctomycetes bacterium]|nr:hypothetical protein [Planctomycetota bacterium]
DSTIWTAYHTIGLGTGDGINTIRVASAKDNENFDIPIEDSRFQFIIQASGAMSDGFVASSGDGYVDLTWNSQDFDDLLGYIMYRYQNLTDSTFTDTTMINTSLIIDTTYTDTAVENLTTYYYLFTAVGTDFSESPYSSPVSATPQDSTPPAVPQNLQATPADGRVLLHWSPNSEGDLLYYKLYRHTANDTSAAGFLDVVLAPGTDYIDNTVVNETPYYYWVTAVDSVNNESGYSAPVSATPSAGIPPFVPQNLQATAGNGQIILNWSANDEADLAYYKVYRHTIDEPATADSVDIVPQPTTAYIDTQVINNLTYYYWLSAVDLTGNESDKSNEAHATPTGANHFTFAANTGNNYTVFIGTALFDSLSLQNGDEVGVFTPSGLCAGGLVWNEALTYQQLIAWGDDPQTGQVDGFSSGQTMFYRYWDLSEQQEIEDVFPDYSQGNGAWGDGPMAVVNLAGYPLLTQPIALIESWNMISSHIDPFQADMGTVWSGINDLVIVKAGDGNTYSSQYGNFIGDWQVLQGYQAYLEAVDTLTITGFFINADTPIPLAGGWNLSAYLLETDIDAETALNSIINCLVICKDGNGNAYS